MIFRKATDDDFMKNSRANESSLDRAYQKNLLQNFYQFYKELNFPEFPPYKKIFKKYGLNYRKEIIEIINLLALKVNVSLSYRNWKQMNFKLKNYVVFYFVNNYGKELFDLICSYFGEKLKNPKEFFNELKGTKIENNVVDFLNVNLVEPQLFDYDYSNMLFCENNDKEGFDFNIDFDSMMASLQIDAVTSYKEENQS